MKIDISAALLAVYRLPEWNMEQAYEVVATFLTADRWINHDADAGESWIFVDDPVGLAASVHRSKRIVFVRPSEMGKVCQGEYVVVEIPDFKQLIVTAPHDLIERTFEPLDPLGDPFCALDLFLATM